MNRLNKLLIGILCILTMESSIFAQDTPITGDSTFLNHKVIIPFGVTTRQAVSGAVTSITPDQFLNYDNVQVFGDVLTGRVPGLLANQLRGIRRPVVTIVDGVLRDASNLNVQAIDRISVLKDANAGVLYGVHAPDGIILITTKRGHPGERTLNFVVEQGLSSPVSLPQYLESADYMKLYNEARINDGLAPVFDEEIIANHENGSRPARYPNTDYYSSEYLEKSKPFTKFISEFSGGNELAQYYSSVGWISSGSLYNTVDRSFDRNRFNIRSNVNLNLTKNINVFLGAVAIFDVDESTIGDFWQDASTLHPYYYSPLIPADLIRHDADLSEGMSLDNVKLVNNRFLLGGTQIYQNNIYGNQAMGSYETAIKRFIQFDQAFDFDMSNQIEGLHFKTHISLDVLNSYTQGVYNSYAVYQPTWETTGGGRDSISAINKIGTDVRTGVQELDNVYFTRQLTAYGLFDYDKKIRNHAISGVLLGYFDQRTVEGVLGPQRAAHLGLRASYAYRNRYYANFNSAYVNGYKLAPGNRGGFSPTLSLGWVLSEENFMNGNSFFDYLKFKTSAGIVNYEFGGMDYRRYTQTFGNYLGNFSWDDGNRSLPSITLNRAANPDLTFEKMKSLNVGIEGQILERSLFFSVNYFNTRNSGQVVQRSTYPAYLMNNIPFENYNETSYRGVELGLDYTINAGNFISRLGVTGTFAESEEIIKDEVWLNSYQYRAGKPSDAIFGLEAIGLFADAADVAANPVQKFGEVQAGDIKYRDQNGDGFIDDNDEIEIGKALPRFSYALSVLLKYKRVSLFALGNGMHGGNDMYSGEYFWVQGDDKYSEEVLNRWTTATATTAIYPRLSSGNNNNNFRNSTHWLYDRNVFRIDRIQLTYELPANNNNRVFSKGMRIFLRGENLAFLSLDANKRQLRIGQEPGFRSFAVGVKLIF